MSGGLLTPKSIEDGFKRARGGTKPAEHPRRELRDGHEIRGLVARDCMRLAAREEGDVPRLEHVRTGGIAYRIKKLRGDRAKMRVTTPLECLSRLAALVPPPRYPLVRYHGVLAPRGAGLAPAGVEQHRTCGAPASAGAEQFLSRRTMPTPHHLAIGAAACDPGGMGEGVRTPYGARGWSPLAALVLVAVGGCVDLSDLTAGTRDAATSDAASDGGTSQGDGDGVGDATGVDSAADGAAAGDAADVCTGACQPLAIWPPIANAGATVMLEGTFASTAVVNFPGASQAATVLGPHRASVVVPASATAGPLTVTTGSQTFGPLPFRRASFTLGLGNFNTQYEQTDTARPMPSLVVARHGAAAVTLGHSLYVIGGYNNRYPYANVERATVNSDGSLSAFSILPGIGLVTARGDYGTAVVGNSIYVIGGSNSSGPVSSVEGATVNPDGSFASSFSTVNGVSLVTGRSNSATAIIGNSIYVIGGWDGSVHSKSVERAIINPDGSLSSFTTVAGVNLVTGRDGPTSAVIGSSLYVIGGNADNDQYQSSVERATIHPDGSLSSFSIVPGISLVTARAWAGGIVLGNSLYVIGGHLGGGNLASVEQAPLNPDGSFASTFYTVSGVSLGSGRDQFASAVVGNSLYLIGGYVGSSTSDSASVQRASIDTDSALATFSTLPGVNLVTARDSQVDAVIGNSLYIVGGATGTNGGNPTGSLASTERAIINPDGSLSSFSPVPTLSLVTARDSASSAVIYNSLYVIGGELNGGTLANVESATIGSDGSPISSFSTASGVNLVVARERHTSVAIGNSLYVIGGRDNSGTCLASVERATINPDGTLTTFATVSGVTLATASGGHTSAVLGNSLYVIGGGCAGNNVASVQRATINSDGSLTTFATLTGVNLAEARGVHTNVVIGGSLYVYGGYGTGAFASTVERATINSNGSLSNFSTVPGVSLSMLRTAFTSTVILNSLYAIGGFGTSSNLANVEQAALP